MNCPDRIFLSHTSRNRDWQARQGDPTQKKQTAVPRPRTGPQPPRAALGCSFPRPAPTAKPSPTNSASGRARICPTKPAALASEMTAREWRAARFRVLRSHHQALGPNQRRTRIQPAAFRCRCRHHRPGLPTWWLDPGSRRRQRPIALVAPAWALSQPPRHVSLCTDPLQAPVACP